MEVVSGIYAICNHNTGEAYIGRSLNIPARWKSHLVPLAGGYHDNRALQAAFDRDGIGAFGLFVLERLDVSHLGSRGTGVARSYFGLSSLEENWLARARAAGVVLYNDQVGRRKAA